MAGTGNGGDDREPQTVPIPDARRPATPKCPSELLYLLWGHGTTADLTPAVVEGDRQLLTLLTANLLGNAIKHNDDRGWVTLATRLAGGVALLELANSRQWVEIGTTR